VRQPEVIREQRDQGAENAQDVKPQRRTNWKVAAKPDLKQQCSQSDCCDCYQRDGTIKSIVSGIDHDQRERKNEQAGCDHSPPARNFRRRRGRGRRRLGRGLGTCHQAISPPFRMLPLYPAAISSALKRRSASTPPRDSRRATSHRGPTPPGWKSPPCRRCAADIS